MTGVAVRGRSGPSPSTSEASRARSASRRLVIAATGLVAVVIAAAFAAIGGIDAEPLRDETHFWQTALQFADPWPPTIETLRGYNELNTPLPFVLWGTFERLTSFGLVAGRLLNAVAMLAVAALIAARAPERPRAFLSVAGLCLCPYLALCATHLYTDALAIALAMVGVHFFDRAQWARAALLFALAVSARQYAIAIPLALFLEGASTRSVPRMAAASAGAAALGMWFLFFGGLGPPAALEAQQIDTGYRPANALYFLSCVGIYGVLPAWLVGLIPRPRAAILGVAASLAFVLVIADPPFRNLDYPVEAMGLWDRALRAVFVSDLARVGVIALVAVAGISTLTRLDRIAFVVAAHAVVLGAAHIAWDKYALPALALFWLECARGTRRPREERVSVRIRPAMSPVR